MIYVYYTEDFICQGESNIARSLIVYALLRDYSIQIHPEDIIKNDAGNPYIKNHPNIHVSISHSDGAVAVAVADFPVGIDVQDIGEAIPSRILSKMYTKNECEYVGESAERFFEIWSKKESLVKLTGEGITKSVAFVDVLTGENTNGAIFTPVDIPGKTAWVSSFNDGDVTTSAVTQKDTERYL